MCQDPTNSFSSFWSAAVNEGEPFGEDGLASGVATGPSPEIEKAISEAAKRSSSEIDVLRPSGTPRSQEPRELPTRKEAR